MKELKLEGLNESIFEHVTKEGLPVYMWVNPKVKSTLMTLSVKYGSIHTKFKVGKEKYEVPNGTAHFLEHVKFNMQEGITAHDEFLKIGGDANAFTTFDYTSYIVFTTQNIIENLNTLLDFVYNPYFTAKLVAKEKGIITEEANMGSDDVYQDTFYHHLRNILNNSEYRNLITGSPKEIKKITADDLKCVYNNFYHPKNMFMCITGNFNPYEIAQAIDDNLSNKQFKDFTKPVVIRNPEDKKVTTNYDEYYTNLTYPRLKVSLKMPLSNFKKLDKLDIRLLSNLIMNINFGNTSDFREELIDNELITAIYPNVDIFDEYLVLTVTATTKYTEEVINRIKKQLKNLVIPAEDVKRKKNAAIGTMILDFDDIEYVNNQIQEDIIYNDKIVTNMKSRLEGHSYKDLEYILDNLDLNNMCVSVFLPNKNPEE